MNPRWVKFGDKEASVRGWGLIGDDSKTLGLIYRSAPISFFEDGWRTDKRHGCGCARVFRTVWGAASHILKVLAAPKAEERFTIVLPASFPK